MKKLKLICEDAIIMFVTDSEYVYNYFLTDKEQIPETIPGITILPLSGEEFMMENQYVIYCDKEPRMVQIDATLNRAILCVPIEELYLPDLIYLLLSMFAKDLNKNDKYFIHTSIVEKRGKSILIVGEPGSGKTTLAMYLCKKYDYKFVCNDRAIIGLRNGIPYVYCGTLQTHIRVGVINEYFPELDCKIDSSKVTNFWEEKIYINPEFINLGIEVKKESEISTLLFAITYPVSDDQTYLVKQRSDNSTLLLMKYFSEYIRADRNVILSLNFPFPCFDTQDLAVKRMKFVEKFVENIGIYDARGNIKKLADYIQNNLP